MFWVPRAPPVFGSSHKSRKELLGYVAARLAASRHRHALTEATPSGGACLLSVCLWLSVQRVALSGANNQLHCPLPCLRPSLQPFALPSALPACISPPSMASTGPGMKRQLDGGDVFDPSKRQRSSQQASRVTTVAPAPSCLLWAHTFGPAAVCTTCSLTLSCSVMPFFALAANVGRVRLWTAR